ncbi:MAG: TonB-dependent receptor [Amphritea sp.]|nr:TonB-dependent receptor [Amphritea sp.]
MFLSRILPLIAATSSLFFPGALYAEFTEDDFLSDIPVTFSATRLPQTLQETPASVTILDKNIIRASSATNLTELLRLVPGMQSYHTATNTSAVAYHGMSDKFPPRMEVMLNGQSIYVPLFSTVVWETLPIEIEDIERIEVVRGTNTVTQGSNALLGSINIITQSALSTPETSLSYRSGSLGSETTRIHHSSNNGGLQYRISSGVTGNDGATFDNGERDPYLKRYLSFNGTYSPSLSDTLTFGFGLSNGYSSVGDIDKDPEPVHREFETQYQHINWQHLLNDSSELNLSYAHSAHDLDAENLTVAVVRSGITDSIFASSALIRAAYGNDPVALAQDFLDSNDPYRATAEIGRIEQHDLGASLTFTPSPDHQLITGLEYRLGQAINRQLLDTSEWVKEENTRLYTNWEYSGVENWLFNNGATVEHSSTGSTRMSPRLAANYQISPLTSLRSSVSRAYRMPSLLEANYESVVYIPTTLQGALGQIYSYEFLANDALKPEQLDSFDIGYLAQWPEYHSSIDIRVFYEKITDGITTTYRQLTTPTTTGDTLYRTYMNRAEWDNRGFELQYRYQSGEGFQPLLLLNYAYIDSNGFRNNGNHKNSATDVIERLESRNPMHTFSALGSVTLPEQIQISASHFYLSSVRWQEAVSSSDPPNAPYHRTDIKVARQWRITHDSDFWLSFTVQNLFNAPYSEFYATNIFERRTYLQAQITF